MKFTIEKVDDSEDMRKIHKLAFGGDPWPGDDHEFWVAKDGHGGVAGFCSAELLTAGTAFLSRGAVVARYNGCGLHRKLIAARMRWLKTQSVTLTVTNTDRYNYQSMINLLKAGFKFAERGVCPRGYAEFHFMYHYLWEGQVPQRLLRESLQRMVEE